MDESKENPVKVEKTREEIEAERKLRKAAKAAKKVKPGAQNGTSEKNDVSDKRQQVQINEKQDKNKGNNDKHSEEKGNNDKKQNIQNNIKQDNSKGNNEKHSEEKVREVKVQGGKAAGAKNAKQPQTEKCDVKVTAISTNNVAEKKDEKTVGGAQEAKAEPPKVAAGEKSKAQLRAERRAIQEAQRAAKAEAAGKGVPPKAKQNAKPAAASNENKPPVKVANDVSLKEVEGILKDKNKRDKSKKSVSWTKPSFYGHLPLIGATVSTGKHISLKADQVKDIHPAFLMLGLHFSNGVIVGGNARALAVLHCIRKLVKEAVPVEGKEFSREVLRKIELNVEFLEQYRPSSVSVFNAARYVRSKCCQFGDEDLPPNKFKEELLDVIDTFVDVNITKAGESIAWNLCQALQFDTSDEIYLTFGWSSTIATVLVRMKEANRTFHVVVVDSPVRPEGKTMARKLANEGIRCTLVSSEHVSFVMKYVHKVLIGCSALLVNSDVLSRAGTSQVALVAKSHNIPVLACCEMYKCANRAQTDAFGVNEQGDPSMLTGPEAPPTLNGLDLAYDITPASFITAVVTENGIYPCEAAKAILRLKQLDNDE